jgi:hypothetical protein
MHRIKFTNLTKAQIDQKLAAAAAGPKCASEFSDVLAEKSQKIVTDNGPASTLLNKYFRQREYEAGQERRAKLGVFSV